MPDTKVNVSHDAVVYTRPPRGGSKRIVFMPMKTEARLRSIAPSEMSEGPVLKTSTNGRIHTRIFEGRLWRQVAHPDRRRDEGPALSEGKFVRWLSNRSAGSEHKAIDWCFTWSPLMTRSRYGHPPCRHPMGFEGGSAGRPILDLRDESQAAVARFVERDVLVAGGVPMVRMPGPMVSLQSTLIRRQLDVVRHPGGGHKSHSSPVPPFFRMDRAEEMMHAVHAVLGADREIDRTWAVEDLEGYGHEGDEDINLTLREWLGTVDRDFEFSDFETSDMAAREMAARSIANLTTNDELPLMADILAQECRLGRERRDREEATDKPRAKGLAERYVEEWALPILAQRTAAVPEGDLEAIDAMRPS